MKKVLLAGIVGGIVMFIWGAVVLMVLPSSMGVKALPNDDALIIAMKTSIPEPGIYMFPGIDIDAERTPEQQVAWEQKFKTGPAGIIVYRPIGGEPMPPSQFLTELLADILAALVAAWVLSLVVASYGTKVILTALLGLFAWFTLSLSNWNCYGFPTAYAGGELIDQIGGWFFAGLVMAKMVKGKGDVT